MVLATQTLGHRANVDGGLSGLLAPERNLGGNSLFRSADRIAAEKRYLKSKWKAHIRFETYKSQERTAIDAPRRQPVSLDG